MIMTILSLPSPYCGEGIKGPLGARLSINLLTRYSAHHDDSDHHCNHGRDDDNDEEETVGNNGVLTKYFRPTFPACTV